MNLKQLPTSLQDLRQQFKKLTYLQKIMIGTGAITTYVVGRFGYTHYTEHQYWVQQRQVLKGQNDIMKTQKEILNKIATLEKAHQGH